MKTSIAFQIIVGCTLALVTSASGNDLPVVYAGFDRTIELSSLGESVILDIIVTDDWQSVGAGLSGWKVSGPGTVTFNVSQPDPLGSALCICEFSQFGVYELGFVFDDGVGIGFDTVVITVTQSPGPPPPSVSAGLDQTITVMKGDPLVSDFFIYVTQGDPWYVGTLSASKVSGPGSITFSIHASIPDYEYYCWCEFSTEGVYELEFTYYDGPLAGSGSDRAKVTITVTPPPPPIVNAGADQTIIAPPGGPFACDVEVWVTDPDGMYDGFLGVSANGPGNVVFTITEMVPLAVYRYHCVFSTFGIYDLTFTYDDPFSGLGSDIVRVTVNEPAQPGNHAPVAEAGGPYTGLVGQSIILDGSGSHDADGDAVMFEWDLDNDGVFDAAGPIIQAIWTAPFSGFVVLRVMDSHGATGTDTATVTINEPALPGATVVQGTVMDAGTGVAIQDATVRISNPGIGIADEMLTDGGGYYRFEGGPELDSCDTLHVTASGYVEQTRTISVVPASVNTFDFALIPVAAAGGCEPLVYLSLDETSGTIAHDLSGHGYNGTLKGNPLWVAGNDGGALRFDGVDDYVDTQFTQNLARWTICCWVSSPAVPAAAPGTGPIHREQNFQINWNHTDPKFRSAAGLSVGGTWYAASFGTLGANTWYHLAATYDGTSLKAYRNGQLVTTTSCPGVPAAESNSLKLARHAGQAVFFAGTIDDVYVYPCALNEDEIKALMSKGVMSILEVVDNGTIGDQQACYTSLDSKTGTRIEYTTPVLNLHDSGPRGHFGGEELFGVVKQGRKTAGNVDHLSLRAEGVIRISAAQAGDWTFGVGSDDGFTLLFPGRNFTSVTNGELYSMPQGKAIRFFGGRALADTLGVIHLPTGDHPFWLTYHEGVREAEVEFFAAKGTHTAFDPDLFRLVGQKDIGKLAIPGFCSQVTMVATRPGSWSGGQIDSLADAKAALASSGRVIYSVQCPFINHVDPETLSAGSGTFGGEMPFPNDVLGKDDNEFAVKVTGLLDIPSDGVYQIGFNSDDGASLRITGKTWQSTVADGTGQAVIAGDELIADVVSGSTFTAGQITLTKGCHAFEAVMFEHDGGSYFELFGRGVSDRGIPDPTWRLLRTTGAQYPVDVTGLQLVRP